MHSNKKHTTTPGIIVTHNNDYTLPLLILDVPSVLPQFATYNLKGGKQIDYSTTYTDPP